MIFLSKVITRDVSVNNGHFRSGGGNGYAGRAIVVHGKPSPEAISMHPYPKGIAKATFDIPEGCTHFKVTAGVDDGARGQQKTPLTFKVYADNLELWKSKPLSAGGPVGECTIALNGAKQITLVVECPGRDDAAWAVWCDPQFLKK